MARHGPPPVGREAKVTGRYLQEAQRQAGITVAELAESMGVRETHVYNYFKGTNRVPFNRLVLASRALGVPLEYFVLGPSYVTQAPYVIFERKTYEDHIAPLRFRLPPPTQADIAAFRKMAEAKIPDAARRESFIKRWIEHFNHLEAGNSQPWVTLRQKR
ncbi:transcriptional regulator with XRE-family HTH domain [Bradyrhizobium sp. USDA 4354]